MVASDLHEAIDQLYSKITVQEKIYALALKWHKDSNTLKTIQSNIQRLKEELVNLLTINPGEIIL